MYVTNTFKSLVHLLVTLMLLMLLGCNASDSDKVQPEPEPKFEPEPPILNFNYCTEYNTQEVELMGGSMADTLRSDLQSGDRLVIVEAPRGVLTSFNELTGEFTYQTPPSRNPDKLIYEHRNALNKTIAIYEHNWIAQPLRIMPLGDSITSGVEFFDGTDYPPLPLRVGYRKNLYEQLVSAVVDFDFIGQGGQRGGQDAGLADPDNNGYAGVDIAFIKNKITEVLNGGPSDVLLLHIGTNNTPADAQGLIEILDEIDLWASLNNPVTVLVSTLVPKRDAILQSMVNQFNSDLRARLQAAPRENVVLTEQALALTSDDLSSESVGVHPNPDGYAKMAETWYASLLDSNTIHECTQEASQVIP